MNSNLRKDLVDSAWEQLWEKHLYEYVVGNQTAPPYCPPQAPCDCSGGGGGGGGGGGPNGGGSGGGDGPSNGNDFHKNNPALSDAANQKARDTFENNKKTIGNGRGPLDRDNRNDVKTNYDAQGRVVGSGGGPYEPGNNYDAGFDTGSKNATGGGVAGGTINYRNGSWDAQIEFDPYKAADEATRMAREAAQANRKKNCDAPTGSGENPDTKDGPTDKTKSEGGDQSSNNKTRPVNNTGSNPKTGNSALGRLPVPKSSGTGSGVKK